MTTVELLTRAADAAGKAAFEFGLRVVVEVTGQPGDIGKRAVDRTSQRLQASGPDHWRAVEATFRAMLDVHSGYPGVGAAIARCHSEGGVYKVGECPSLLRLRPLAEQVLQHLGDTP